MEWAQAVLRCNYFKSRYLFFSAGYKFLFSRRRCVSKLQAIFKCERCRIGTFGNFYIVFSNGDVWTKAAVQHQHIRPFGEGFDGAVGIFGSFGFNQLNSSFDGNGSRIVGAFQRAEFRLVEHIWPETADGYGNIGIFELA